MDHFWVETLRANAGRKWGTYFIVSTVKKNIYIADVYFTVFSSTPR